uniref:Uncharacterized protein n=1 Tax=Salarias fasciatus TaxID=181472 RepID=A0A672JB38_SALFA
VVERRCSFFHSFDSSREEEERENPCTEKKNLNSETDTDLLSKKESVPSRAAEILPIDCNLEDMKDNWVPLKELDAFLQTPEAALHAFQKKFSSLVLSLVIEILQKHPDDLDQRQDQGAERQGACVVSEQEEHTERGEDGVRRDVVRLFEGPVIRGEGPRESDLAQSRHEVGTPEEEEDVVELKQDEVFVVDRLASVEGKQALCVWTLRGNEQNSSRTRRLHRNTRLTILKRLKGKDTPQ